MVFLPSGRTVVRPEREAVECTVERALLFSCFEVTRGEWTLWAERTGGFHGAASFASDWSSSTRHWPATGMTLEEARAFAHDAGMRLPTAGEWMALACGSRAAQWPWASGPQESIANTAELGLIRPAAVGTFENGRTPSGVYDLSGNVWEWVDPPLPQIVEWSQEAQPRVSFDWSPVDLGRAFGLDQVWTLEPRFPTWESVERVEPVLSWSAVHEKPRRDENWAMGGSYLYPAIPLHGRDREGELFFAAQGRTSAHRSLDVGLRLVVDAEDYLWRHAPEWSAKSFEERLRRLGASAGWGRGALPLLDRLCARDGAPMALRWLMEGAQR